MPSLATPRRRFAALVLAFAAAPLAAATPDVGKIITGNPVSVRQTEALAKRADFLITEVEGAQSQIRVTLDAYTTLVNSSAGDLRKPYRKLDKSIARCEKRRADVAWRADDARKEADKYFSGWAARLPQIVAADLRARSEARMNDSRARFDGILEAGRRASEAYQPFLAKLRDQWTYLGHDLNPSGLASLRPDAQELIESGTQVLLEIDGSLRQAREYVQSIRSIQPPPPPPPAPATPAPPAGS
jgi:hypothetical protein